MSRTLHLVSPHMKGDDVSHLQMLLKQHRWYGGGVDGEFGPLTYQAVYRAKYWLGYASPDHAAGDVLRSYLEGRAQPTTVMRAHASLRRRKAQKIVQGAQLVATARVYLGTKESPPNSNDVLFSRWYGIIGAWCAMFVSFVANKVGYKQFKAGVFVAYVPFLLAAAREGRDGCTLVHSSEVSVGDLVLYDWDRDGTPDHVGFFAGWKTVGETFLAVEGNTAVGNESDGGEVMQRERWIANVEAFVRIH